MKLFFQKSQYEKIKKIVFFFISSLLIVGTLLKIYRHSLDLYLTPQQLLDAKNYQQEYYLCGTVEKNSLLHAEGKIGFTLSDAKNPDIKINVAFFSTPPKLLREEQEAIVLGHFDPAANLFIAHRVMSKHDQYYRPKEEV